MRLELALSRNYIIANEVTAVKEIKMKIYISYKITDGPYGGGNQFIKNLAKYLESFNLLTNDISTAQVILTNAFFSPPLLSSYDSLFSLKRINPKVKLLHRMDGIFDLVRGHDFLYLDKLVSSWARLCVDGVIFQSDYCRDIQYKYGYPSDILAAVIGNASDRSIFYPPHNRNHIDNRVHLIYTSWSNNIRKGFSTLQMLDNTLDFNRYSFTFVGNSPVTFKNIRHIPAKPSGELAELLRGADIFVGLSHNEPCSNAIGEALACGLPALIRNTGGNPSFVPQGAVLYDRDEDIPAALEYMAINMDKLRAQLRPLDMEKVAHQYVAFAERLVTETPTRRPDSHKFLALRKKLREHYPELPRRYAWRCKLWMEGLWS